MRCDRNQPCLRCIKSGLADKCHFGGVVGDHSPDKHTIPREAQVVFSIDADGTRRGSGDAHAAPHTLQSHDASEEAQALNMPAERPQSFRTQKAPLADYPQRLSLPLTASAPPADKAAPESSPTSDILWYGNRDVDSFIEPLHGQTIRMPKSMFRDEKGVSTYHGRSHEVILLSQFADMTAFVGLSQEERALLRQLQRTSNEEKPGSSDRSDADRHYVHGLRGLLPSQEATVQLVNAYVHNFESYYRVLHTPSLLKDLPRLWDASAPPDTSFVAMVLAVCTISLCFTSNFPAELKDPSELCTQWLAAIQLWLLQQNPRNHLSLSYLQVNCLYLIASQMSWPRPQCNTTWISTGTLLRTAIAAGYNQDPSKLIKVSPIQAELRRRIWFTVLELDLQASLDGGLPPTCSTGDYDCGSPSNVDDDQLRNTLNPSFDRKPLSSFTQSSFQVLLAKSWGLRHRICRMINSIDLKTPYEDVLRIDAELRHLLEEASDVLRPEPSNFRKSMFAIHIRKSVLALHRPFAARAVYDPMYLHSRQTCLETSLTILRHVVDISDEGFSPDQSIPSTHSHDVLNTCYSGVSTAAFLLCHELLRRATDEKRRAETMHYDVDCPYAGSCVWNHSQQELLTGMLRRLVDALKADEKWKSLRGWLEMGLSLANAIAEGEDTVLVLREIVKTRLQAYRETLRPKMNQPWGPWGISGGDDLRMSQDMPFDQAFPFDFFSDLTNANNAVYEPGGPMLTS